MRTDSAERKSGSIPAAQMTPMIDIVFLLLVFFVMTFQVASREGDFHVKMPLVVQPTATQSPEKLPPMVVRLTAGHGGGLERIQLNERDFGVNFGNLHQYLVDLLGNERGPGRMQQTAEVELDCDYGLHYDHVIQAVTALSGYVDADGNTVTLVEQIKLAPPRRPRRTQALINQ